MQSTEFSLVLKVALNLMKIMAMAMGLAKRVSSQLELTVRCVRYGGAEYM